MGQTDKNAATQPTQPGLAMWIATGLGVGFAPVAPGTFGTLWGIPLAIGLQSIPGWPWHLLTIIALILVGVPLCTAAARQLGGKKDPGAVVWDEIVTLPITFFLIPIDFDRPGWAIFTLVAGFALHRLFDISKIPPARQLEKLPGGLGIMADDVAAALYSHGALRLVLWGAAQIWSGSP